jgi:predicted Fe-Mo cluster-binding NifX family protein
MTSVTKIAVASQNRRNVTGHAGKCRRFWVYDIESGAVKGRQLLELPREQSFHEHTGAEPHPLQGVQVLITGGMGEGLARRLAGMGIEGLVTPETDPDRAVAAYLAGTLPLGQPEAHGDPLHGHDHA